MSNGVCENSTGEDLAVYGGSSDGAWDNQLFRLPPGRRTPDTFDCDGIYVPKDRSVKQAVFPTKAGPLAVKYKPLLTFNIELEGTMYDLPNHIPNFGVFTPSESKCPTNSEQICWRIPDELQSWVKTLPEVPGHTTI